MKSKLGRLPYHTQKTVILSETNREHRLKRVRGLLARTLPGQHMKTVFFEGEPFALEVADNPENNYLLARSP